jgi:superfamily II DNA or RNA helicase/intein/homing endonuclease
MTSNKITILDNKSCQFETEDISLLTSLRSFLSFKPIGIEFTPAYKRGWDGVTYLLNKKGEFSLGLLETVKNYLERNAEEYTIQDLRASLISSEPLPIDARLKDLGKIPRDYQMEIVNAALQNRKGIIRACTGSGKCSDINSLHLTEFGMLNYAELQQMINGNLAAGETAPLKIKVATPLTNNKIDKSSLLYRDGYGTSKKITTQYGFKITATPDHKIQILNNEGNIVWKKFSELKVNDYSIISYGNQLFGKEVISLDDAYWYGLLIGDGGMTLKHTTRITNEDQHILRFVKKYLHNKNIQYTVDIANPDSSDKCKTISIYNTVYRKSLEKFGFKYSKSIHKTLPLNIRKLSKEPLAMVLRGIYETDGWVEDKSNKLAICLGLSNKKLIDQIHLILLNFGIVASRRLKKTTNEDSHILTIYKEFIDVFLNEIGLDQAGHKYKTIMKALKNNKKINNSNTNLIPFQAIKLEKLKSNYDMLFGKNSWFKNCPIKKSTIRSWSGKSAWRRPSREKLVIFINWYKNTLISKNLLTKDISKIIEDILFICNSKYYYLPITKIKNTHSDNWDFVIPNTHSFVSQGFINHNTLVSSIITASLNKPTNIYVISLDLLQQFHSLFCEIFDEPIGFIGNGRCEISRINIVSVWSAGKALGNKEALSGEDDDFEEEDNPSNYPRIVKMLKSTKVHLFDECHSVQSATIRSIYNAIDPEYIYGLSGTPYRNDGCELLSTSILGDQIIDVPASRLIAEKWLAQPLIKFVRVPKMKGINGENYQSIYKSYIVENEIRNNLIIENAKMLLEKGYQVLILFKQLNHGKILSELLNEQGIDHEYLSGIDSLEERTRVKEKLLKKEANLILSSKIFDQGIDLPTLSGLILANSGKSSISVLQRAGRIIRSYPGKTYCCIVDFYDDVKYLKNHSLVRYNIYKSESGFKVFACEGMI